MADASNFLVLCRDAPTKQKQINVGLEHGSVVHPFRNGKIRFKLLTEATISIANTGATTDTVLIKDTTSLFSFERSTLFNSTIQNESKEEEILAGIAFMVDHTTTSPDTDAGHLRFQLKMRRESGTAPTYSAKSLTTRDFEFDSFKVVEAAGSETLPYAGPLLYDFHNPKIVKRSDTETEYIGCTCILWRNTAEFPTFTAHTVVTTYTIKVYGWAVLVDLSIMKSGAFKSMDELWSQFLKEA
jgi:hypothetical protein